MCVCVCVCHVCIYIGKTFPSTNFRVNGHRSCYSAILRSSAKNQEFKLDEFDDIDDVNVLGAYFFTVNGKREKSDFNKYFTFDILCTTSPENLRKCEQYYINKLKTLYPFGLNNVNSISGR